MTIRDTVSFHYAHGRFDSDGNPVDAEGSNGAAKVLLDQLSGRAARSATPAPAARTRPDHIELLIADPAKIFDLSTQKFRRRSPSQAPVHLR